MLDIEQKYKDLYTTYGGKSIRLIFFKDNFRALYPSEILYPSEQTYPSEMSADSIAFEITDDMVHSDTLTISESLCSEQNLDFGACESAQVEIVISNPPRNITGLEFMLVTSFAGYDLVKGIYIVDSTPREADRNTRRIIAYDRMIKFDHDVSGWYNTLKFPMTLKEFRDSLCGFVGVTQKDNIHLINDDMAVEKTISPDSLNGRDVLRYICQINGVFGNINQIGELQYIAIPKKTEITDTINIYKSVESEEYTVPDIDTVKIQKEEGDIGGVSSGGDDMNTLIVQGNFLVYGKTTSQQDEIANRILTMVSSLEYRPAVAEISGAPWYELGDRLRIETSDGPVNTIIMSRVSVGIQGVMDTIESTGNKELKRVFNVRSQIIEAKGLVAVLKRTVSEVSNNLTNFENQTNSKFTQTSEKIEAEVTRAKGAEGQLGSRITQTATEIRTEVSNTSKNLQSQITQQAGQIALKVSQGDVTKQLNSELKITGNAIALTTGHFTINAKNMTLDAAGNATFSGAITGATINVAGGNFVVDAQGKIKMTGAELDGCLNTGTMGADYVNANYITTRHIESTQGADIYGTLMVGDTITSNRLECEYISCYSIYSSSAGESWSDERLKEELTDMPINISYDFISKLRPLTYKMKCRGSYGAGFSAQQVVKLIKETGLSAALVGYKDGYLLLRYQNFIPIIVAAIQHMQKEIDSLKEEAK